MCEQSDHLSDIFAFKKFADIYHHRAHKQNDYDFSTAITHVVCVSMSITHFYANNSQILPLDKLNFMLCVHTHLTLCIFTTTHILHIEQYIGSKQQTSNRIFVAIHMATKLSSHTALTVSHPNHRTRPSQDGSISRASASVGQPVERTK